MKKFKICVLIMLAAVMSFSSVLSGCKKPQTLIPPPPPDETLAGYDFVTDGKTEFKIVVAANADENETVAADELRIFINEACQTNIPVITDAEASDGERGKYISVGRNALFNKSGIAVDNDRLGTSGYMLVTKGKTVFLIAGWDVYLRESRYGIIYAAYGLLERLISLRIFTTDCYTYNAGPTVAMKNFTVTELPDYDWRAIADRYLYTGLRPYQRMRLMSLDLNIWGGHHTHYYVLPPTEDCGFYNSPYNTYIKGDKVYLKDHPDWYNNAGSELNFTNEEMIDEYIRRCKEILTDNPRTSLVYFGSMDNVKGPDDAHLDYAMEHYNTNGAGLYVVFINKVSAALDKWVETEFPGRKLFYQAMFYHWNLNAPVNEDGTPHSEWVIPRPNVTIDFVPIDMPSWVVPMDAPANSGVLGNIEKWHKITDNLSIYTYGANYNMYMTNFHDFFSFAPNLKLGLKYGFRGWYEEITAQSVKPSFNEMRIFLHSQLMWDTSRGTMALMHEFIDAFYGSAAPFVKEYLDLTIENNNANVASTKLKQGCYSGDSAAKELYSFEVVYRMSAALRAGEVALEALRETDYPLFDKLRNRVRIQMVTVLFLVLSHYQTYFTRAENIAMIDELEITCARNGITYVYGADLGTGIRNNVEKWRQQNF